MAGENELTAAVSRRQGFGCLALAAFSLIGTALFVVLGIQCMQSHDLFDCIGLLTIFPAAFAAIGLTSAAIGLQRFTTAGRQSTSSTRLGALETGWQPLQPAPRPDILPGSMQAAERGDRPHAPGSSLPDPQERIAHQQQDEDA